MTAWLPAALVSVAEATPVAVVVATRWQWSDACTPGPCRRAPLDYTDEDAWRAASVLTTVMKPEHVVVIYPPEEPAWRVTAPPLPEGVQLWQGPPTADAIDAAVRTLRERVPSDETLELVLFVSGHGSPSGVHLHEDRYTLEALKERLVRSDPDLDLTAVVADACYSANWRGPASAEGTALVWPSQWAHLELLVDNRTREDEDLQGGTFTRMALSALVGGADANRDGATVPQEIANALDQWRRALNHPVDPVIRADAHEIPRVEADGGDERARLAPVPERSATLELAPDADHPVRWLVHRVFLGDDEPDEWRGRELPLFEFMVYPDEEALTVRIPEGTWRVWRVPYLLPERTPNALRALEEVVFATGCQLTTTAGAPALVLDPGRPGPCAFDLRAYNPVRGGDEAGAAAVDAVPEDDVVARLYAFEPFAPRPPRPTTNLRFFAGGASLGVGLAAEPPMVDRGVPLLGGAATVLVTPRNEEGRTAVLVDARATVEVGPSPQPSRMVSGAVTVGPDRGVIASQHARGGLFARGGVGGLVVAGPAGARASWTPAVDLGSSLTVNAGEWFVRLEAPILEARMPVVQQPAPLEATGDASAPLGAPEPIRVAGSVVVGRR